MWKILLIEIQNKRLFNFQLWIDFAVKVGGMRIVQHKKEGEKVEVPVPTEDEVAEFSSR